MKGSILAAVLVFLIGPAVTQAQVGTAFTYQGRLTDAGGPASGAYDFRFILMDADVGGSQVGPILLRDDVVVANGQFTISLDFGAAFNGNKRFLEIAIRPGASTGAYSPLAGRQELTPSPNAVFSSSAGSVTGIVPIANGGTGSPTQNFVDLTTAQTVGGTKTFSSPIAGSVTGSAASVTGIVPIANGGTGSATAAGARTALGAQPLVTGVCAAGSSIRVVNADGTVTCQTDTNSGGTVTSVATGAGLTGGPINGTGTVAVAPLGITSSMIANGAVGSAQIANGAVGVAQVNTAQVQTRVSGTCAFGSSVQTINPDGTVVCQSDNAQPGFTLTTLDSTGSVGAYTSVTIGADGLGLISYYDNTNQDLKVAHCSNTACSTATTATLDSTGIVGQYTSITIGTDGLGLISYRDSTNADLKVAHCSDTACSTATTATLDSTGDVGYYSSITIGTDGLGLISHGDLTNQDLKVAHCSNIACSTATPATLDSTATVGGYTSITIGTDGLGLVSYSDNNSLDLKVAHCSNTACSAATPATLDSTGDVGRDTSITIGTDGLGLISYRDATNGDLKVAHCSNTPCTPNVRRR